MKHKFLNLFNTFWCKTFKIPTKLDQNAPYKKVF